MTRTALVTGATRGLGRQVCRELARRGWRVLLTGRDGAAARAAATELAAAGGAVVPHRLDVAEPGGPEALAAALRDAGETLDLLVNNAGVYLEAHEPDAVRRTVAVDFLGPLHVTRALLPLLRDGGHVVMVSSGLGELVGQPAALRARLTDPTLDEAGLIRLMTGDGAAPPASPYGASKAALNALVRLLAVELAPRRIRVNAVCPGWVRTDMGGAGATRSVEQGGDSILATALAEDASTGGFFRDGRAIEF